MDMLEQLNNDGKDLWIISNLYWNKNAAVRIENATGDFVQIKKEVRQGCVFSPHLFNLYSEKILREIENYQDL